MQVEEMMSGVVQLEVVTLVLFAQVIISAVISPGGGGARNFTCKQQCNPHFAC